MALSKHKQTCGFQFYIDFANRKNFRTAPVSSFPHTALSLGFDENVVENLLVEVAYLDDGPQKRTVHWLATVVEKKGSLIRLRYLGAGADPSRDIWRNFAAYKAPVGDELDERVFRVGWAQENQRPLEPPAEIRESHQDWEEFLEEQHLASFGEVLVKDHHSIARTENESSFRKEMKLEVTDINEMEALRPAIVVGAIGLRIKFSFIDNDGNEQFCHFHEFSDEYHLPGTWSLIKRKINSAPEYKKGSENKRRNFEGPPTENVARVQHRSPRLIPRPLAERLQKYIFKTGLQLEVVDPLRPGISVATVVEVLPGGYLIIEIVHKRDRNPEKHEKYRVCIHETSDSLLPPGFAAELLRDLLDSHFNPPTEDFRYDRNAMVPKEMLHRQIPRHGFEVGQLLEVCGVAGSDQIYVGRIARIVGHLLLIHFEGWGKEHDHFFPMTSVDLYHVGWCDSVGHPLTLPHSYKPSKEMVPSRRRQPTLGHNNMLPG